MKRFTLAAFSVIVFLATSLLGQSNPVPFVNQPLVPTTVVPGSAAFTLTVNGTGFVSGSVVNWNGSPRTTTFVSSSQLTASISAADVATANTTVVTVANPSPGGGRSNSASFEITNGTPSISFSVTSLTVGTNPYSVATGDFNGDGLLDVVVANDKSSSVSVLLGNGDGTFQTHVDYATLSGPISVVVGDFNGDGKLDLGVVDVDVSMVSILLGNGDGTFQPHTDYAAGANPISGAVGDFNGDGKLDIAIVSIDNTPVVAILIGNGDGTFQPEVDYTAGIEPFSLAVGDFNRDGKLDLAVADAFSNNVSILLGNGDGTFQTPIDYATDIFPYEVATADFNGDGKLDLAVGTSNRTMSVLLGNGDGTFQPHIDYSTGIAESYNIGIGDINGDGKIDVVLPDGGRGIAIVLGNGDGTFQPPADFNTGSAPTAVSIGDFNHDGRMDLAVTASGSDEVSIVLQTVFPVVTLNPTSIVFASQNVGTTSAAQGVTLSNTGNATLELSSITILGANPGDFVETNTCGGSVAAGHSCTISVTFTPALAGARSANLTIEDNATNNPQIVTLSGTGVAPAVSLSRNAVLFGNQVVGTVSSGRDVILKNTGTAPLHISSITANGNFTQTNTCGGSVAVGASCTITIQFSPTVIGDRTGVVTIADNAGPPTQTIHLFGTGTDVSLSTLSLTFAPQKVGTTSPPSSIRLTNVGRTTLTFSSFTISGVNGADFNQGNNCGTNLLGGHSCTISVTFTPTATGTRNATLAISDNGGGSPQNVTLQGTGK